jgi:hypothetical protein
MLFKEIIAVYLVESYETRTYKMNSYVVLSIWDVQLPRGFTGLSGSYAYHLCPVET